MALQGSGPVTSRPALVDALRQDQDRPSSATAGEERPPRLRHLARRHRQPTSPARSSNVRKRRPRPRAAPRLERAMAIDFPRQASRCYGTEALVIKNHQGLVTPAQLRRLGPLLPRPCRTASCWRRAAPTRPAPSSGCGCRRAASCPDCWHPMEWVEAPQVGRVFTFSTVSLPRRAVQAAPAGTPHHSASNSRACARKLMSWTGRTARRSSACLCGRSSTRRARRTRSWTWPGVPPDAAGRVPPGRGGARHGLRPTG